MKHVQCDFCRGSPAHRIQFELDRKFGPLGDIEIHYEYTDICPRCLMERIGKFLQDQPQNIKEAFIAAVRVPENMAA